MDVIYLAGGQGKRTNLGYPKQFAYLGGKPIIMHGLEVLQNMPEITRIIIPCVEDIRVIKLLRQYNITKGATIPGGETRQQSVKRGIMCVNSEYVLICEAVRPFLTADFVRTIIKYQSDFVTPIRQSLASVVLMNGGYIDRRFVGEVQMPQKYKTSVLQEAHYTTRMEDASDDAVLVIETLGLLPNVIYGIEQNIKITTPLDLTIAEAIYESNINRE